MKNINMNNINMNYINMNNIENNNKGVLQSAHVHRKGAEGAIYSNITPAHQDLSIPETISTP